MIVTELQVMLPARLQARDIPSYIPLTRYTSTKAPDCPLNEVTCTWPYGRSTRGMAVPKAQNQFSGVRKRADDARYSPIAVSLQLIGMKTSKINQDQRLI